MAEKLGNEGVIYYEVGVGTDSWRMILKVRNNDLTMSASEIDTSTRNNDGWKTSRAGMKTWGASFDMLYDTANEGWLELKQAFWDNTRIHVKIVDSTDGEGIIGYANVTQFDRGEPMDDMMTTAVTLVNATKPDWGS